MSATGWRRTVLALAIVALPVRPQTPPPAMAVPRQLSLEQAEKLLVERNLSIAAAKSGVDASKAGKAIAAYKPNPVIELGSEQIPFAQPSDHGLMSLPRFFTTDPNAGANPVWTLQFNKLIERGGKRERRTEQAGFVLDAAQASVLDTTRTQLFLLRQAFTAAILARENLELAEKTDAQYAKTEQLTSVRVETGDAAKVEIYRVHAGRLQFQQAILQAKTAYEQATRDILNILNARVEEVQTGAPDPTFPAALRTAPLEIRDAFQPRVVVSPLDELKRIAGDERPDVQAALALLHAAEKGTQLAEAQRHRDFSVAGEYQRVGSDSSLGVIVQFPFFLYNNQKMGIVQASAMQRAADAEYRQARTQAVTDVEKAWQSHLNAKKALELYSEDNLKQVEKLRDVAEYSYKEGATTLFELLDAARTVNLTLQAYNQARSDYQMSLWLLEQAIGRTLP